MIHLGDQSQISHYVDDYEYYNGAAGNLGVVPPSQLQTIQSRGNKDYKTNMSAPPDNDFGEQHRRRNLSHLSAALSARDASKVHHSPSIHPSNQHITLPSDVRRDQTPLRMPVSSQ